MSMRREDLPDPDGPVSATVSPRADLQRDAVQDVDGARIAVERQPRIGRGRERDLP
jgi:hypothetical protein